MYFFPALVSKRVATEGSLTVSDTSSSSGPSSSIFSSAGPFSQANRSWPSVSTTDTDVTTPSLCSDNENDDVSPEDALPPTPPRRPPTPPRRLKRQSRHRAVMDTPDADKSLPEIIDLVGDADADVDIPLPTHHTPSPVDSPMRRRTPFSPENAFANRVPSSPLPAHAVSKKPRPPGRIRIGQLRIQPVPFPDANKSSGHIPLPSSGPIVPVAAAAAQKMKQQQSKPATRIPRAQPLAPAAKIAPADISSQSVSPHDRRRRTLDAEIRRAGDQLWDEDDEYGLDNGTLVGVGMKDMQGGFLARGGGGGSPVYMGDGYVQGAERHRRPSQRSVNSIV